MRVRWRDGMERALYGVDGFFRTGETGPRGHFRTSVHASPLFAGALLHLAARIDRALGHPDPFDVVDVGAGRGELLTALAVAAARVDGAGHATTPTAAGESTAPVSTTPMASANPVVSATPLASTTAVEGATPAASTTAVEGATPVASTTAVEGATPVASTTQGEAGAPGEAAAPGGTTGPVRGLAERLQLTAVEIAPRPAGLPADIAWRATMPDRVVGLLIATEWLDNVPLDVAEIGDDGAIRRVLVDPTTGEESSGGPVDAADVFWLARWWPLAGRPPGTRAEIGWPRDTAWADAVATVEAGCALAVDYGHLRADRPLLGSMTGYRDGRQVPPVPDGNCDVTAHVAMDAVAAAAGTAYTLVSQRDALRALGVDGARPPLSLASSDPAGYVRALSAAGAAAELTDPNGLGGHWWLLHGIGMDVPPLPARSSSPPGDPASRSTR